MRSVCPLDCPDRCSLDVSVEDGRIKTIDGSRLNPMTNGFICAKVRGYAQRVDGPERLLHPMRRSGAKGEGRFSRISWDEALDSIAQAFGAARDQHGGEAILPFAYGGSNGLLSQGTVDERLFRSLGASRLDRTVCAAQTTAVAQALYGRMSSVDFPDFAEARLIVIWGANPKASNIHLMPYLKAARDAGARIALVDPRLTLPATFVDMHLPVLPGSDGAVALAMIAHMERLGRVDRAFLKTWAVDWERLLEEARPWSLERAAARAGISASAIGALAEAYVAAEPAIIRCGWGVERNRNGEAAVAAILALPAFGGKFGRVGGGYALSSAEAYKVDGNRLAGVPEMKTRIINMSRLGRVLLEEQNPPVKALFIYDANPVVTLPDQSRVVQGLLREDLFTVVFDQVLTDTALYADVVLPATTFLEQRELHISYGTYNVMLSEPVIPRRGEARPNAEVFEQLGHRFGISSLSQDALLAEAVSAIEGPLVEEPGSRLERLQREGALRFDFQGRDRPVQFVSAFPGTPDRKIHLFASELGESPYRVFDDPGAESLALISPATDKSICSIMAEYGPANATLEMNPEDAASRGLRDGQTVSVHNRLGEVRVPLALNPKLRKGVVYLPKGIWNRHTENGRVGTTLVPDDVSPISGGALFNDARVDVSAAS